MPLVMTPTVDEVRTSYSRVPPNWAANYSEDRVLAQLDFRHEAA